MKLINCTTINYNPPREKAWINGTFEYSSIADYKFSIQLGDNNIIETSVFKQIIQGKNLENHICISTQAGCKFGCKMCKSGQAGYIRNLTANEILEQINITSEYLKLKMFDQISFMGIGEPLDNYGYFIDSIKKLIKKEPRYAKKISFATVGLPDKLLQLSNHISQNIIPPFNMIWLSLHAPTNEKRAQIMPIANRITIKKVLDATKILARKHRTIKIWINYMLYKGFNNSHEDACKLTELLQDTQNEFSLMITEPNGDLPNYHGGTFADSERFETYLRNIGMRNPISKFVAAGREIKAGCGEFIFKPYK